MEKIKTSKIITFKANVQTIQWTAKKPPEINSLLTDTKTGAIYKVMDIQVKILQIN